jgi:hypothetical protein
VYELEDIGEKLGAHKKWEIEESEEEVCRL